MRIVAPAILAVASAVYVFPDVFSGFSDFDDEGYMLQILKGPEAGQALYDQTYSQYGPFYNLFHGAVLDLTNIGFSHNSGRFLVICMWIITGALCGLATVRMSGSMIAGGVAQLLVTWRLSTYGSEVGLHPVTLIAFLLASLVVTSTFLDEKRRWPGITLGLLLAGLTLTKINVGVFAIAAGGLLFIAGARTQRVAKRPLTPLFAALVCLALPSLVMINDLAAVMSFAALVTGSTASMILVMIRTPFPPIVRKLGLHGAVGFCAGLAGILSWTFLRGSSISGVWEGVLIEPLSQRAAFSFFVPIGSLGVIFCLASLAVCCWWFWTHPSWIARIVPYLKILASELIIMAVLTYPLIGSPFVVALPLLWIASLPSVTKEPSIARVFLPVLAVLQSLHAYPVAGSQVIVGSFLFLVVAVIAIYESLLDLDVAAKDVHQRRLRLLTATAASTMLLVTSVYMVNETMARWAHYRRLHALPFDGATRVHVPEGQHRTITDVVAALRARCTTFYSVPGMASYYAFAGLPSPTFQTPTSWMYLLDEEQQSDVVQAMDRSARPCLLRNNDLLGFWTRGRKPPRGPLMTYLESQFELMARQGPIELQARSSTDANE